MEVQLSGYRRNTRFDFIVRNSQAETATSKEILNLNIQSTQSDVIWNLRIGILELGCWSLEL